MDALASFAFNSNNFQSDWSNTLSVLLAANPKSQFHGNQEDMYRALLAIQPMEDSKSQPTLFMSAFNASLTPPAMSRCVSTDNSKNLLNQCPQPQGLQAAASAPLSHPQPTQTSAIPFNFLQMQMSAPLSLPPFNHYSIPNAPSLMNRGYSLEYPLSSRTSTSSVEFSSPSPSTDSSTVSSPNPALYSSLVSVEDSEYDEEQSKASIQRQIQAARQHNLAVASTFQEHLAVSSASACAAAEASCAMDSAPQLEVKTRRGRRRRRDGNDESQERRRRRRLESHMRYDRHRRDVLQKNFY